MLPNMKKIIPVLLSLSFLFSCSEEISSSIEKKQVPYEEESVCLIPEEMKNYLIQEEQNKQFKALNDHYLYNASSYCDYSNPVSISFEASSNSPYTINISNSEDFSSFYTVTTPSSSYLIKDPIPGQSYFYEVIDSYNSILKKGKIYIEKEKHLSVRYMNVDGTNNVRDLGGWGASNGNEVGYGLIYRGAKLNGDNCLSDDGFDFVRNVMGVKTEIDLRNESDDLGQTYAAFAKKSFDLYDRAYLKDDEFPYQMYDDIVKDLAKPMNRKIFSYLADKENYPFYIHCSAGADRTGTLCALINGVLGVSEEDLIRDYELTSFSKQGNRWRAASNAEGTDFDLSQFDTSGGVNAKWQAFMNLIKGAGKEGDSLETCFNNFLVNVIGVNQDDINSMKSIMLGLERDYSSNSNVMEDCTHGGHAVFINGNERIEFETKPVGHDFKRNGSVSYCLGCNKLIKAKKDETDVKNGYSLSEDIVKATSVSKKEMEIKDNRIVFAPYMASKDPVGFILTSKNGTLSYLELTIYSLLIESEDNLFDMNKYSCDLIDIKGNTSTYGYFKLKKDIECTRVWNKEYALGVNATKGKSNSFKGFIDGNNKTISNFVVSSLDGSLIYTSGKETEIYDLTLKGSSLDSYWGSDFLIAYSYGGKLSNLNVEVSLGKGDATFNNTALLGTIGYKEKISEPIYLQNVYIKNLGEKQIDFSSCLGQLYYDVDEKSSLQGALKIKEVTIEGFASSLIAFNSKENKIKPYGDYESIVSILGKGNVESLRII